MTFDNHPELSSKLKEMPVPKHGLEQDHDLLAPTTGISVDNRQIALLRIRPAIMIAFASLAICGILCLLLPFLASIAANLFHTAEMASLKQLTHDFRFGIYFMGVVFLMLNAYYASRVHRLAVFDKTNNTTVIRKSRFMGKSTVADSVVTLQLSQLCGLQIIQYDTRREFGDGSDVHDRSKGKGNQFELILVHNNTERTTLIKHAQYREISTDAHKLSTFTNLPVFDYSNPQTRHLNLHKSKWKVSDDDGNTTLEF